MTSDPARGHGLAAPYDAVFVHGFGGPEEAADVLPFLHRVTGGRVPQERLAEVGEHYYARGGRSPINAETAALADALAEELRRRGLGLRVGWGNRFAAPFAADVLADLAGSGARRVLAVRTSAYPSYAGCRAYREELAAAVASDPRLTGVEIDQVRPYALHPGFSATMARLATDATRRLLQTSGLPAGDVRLLCVTHSLPVAAEATSGPPPGGAYLRWHRAVAEALAAEVGATLEVDFAADLAFCSRSGPPQQPWLEPDIADRLAELAEEGVRGVVIVPIGFVADHMEVVHDLDEVALGRARELGIVAARVPTVRTDPEFVTGLADLVLERAAEARGEEPRRPVWPRLPLLPARCAPDCCPAPHRPAALKESPA